MKVSTDTIVRSVCMIVALLNTLLAILGKDKLPFTDSEIYSGLTAVAAVVTTLIAWWKNNSFTQPALKADEQLKIERQEGSIESEEV